MAQNDETNGMPSPSLKAFVSSFRDAGLAVELSSSLLQRLCSTISGRNELEKRLSLLERYYGGADDSDAGSRRTKMDHFFLHKSTDERFASEVVSGLVDLVADLPETRLERLHGAGGTLVLRADDQMSVVHDDEESDTDVEVASLVTALNLLMSRFDLRERFLQLRSDGRREAFFTTGVSEGIALCNAGLLEDTTIEELMEFAAW